MSVYKFVGDGWILLFSTKVDGQGLFNFLKSLSEYSRDLLEDLSKKYLENPPTISGLTFGIEKDYRR